MTEIKPTAVCSDVAERLCADTYAMPSEWSLVLEHLDADGFGDLLIIYALEDAEEIWEPPASWISTGPPWTLQTRYFLFGDFTPGTVGYGGRRINAVITCCASPYGILVNKKDIEWQD
jgi:hypothetical protein